MSKLPPPALTDAVQASMNEEFAALMNSVRITDQFKVSFDEATYNLYQSVYSDYETFIAQREADRVALAEIESESVTPLQKAEYAQRLLANVEKHSERMAELTRRFGEVLRTYMAKSGTTGD